MSGCASTVIPRYGKSLLAPPTTRKELCGDVLDTSVKLRLVLPTSGKPPGDTTDSRSSFAWCYLALAQHESGLVAEAKESFEGAKECAARTNPSNLSLDFGAMREARSVFVK